MKNSIKRIEELCERANSIARQIADEESGIRLWYVYDALSAELYQMVMWHNSMTEDNLLIKRLEEDDEPLLHAEDYGRVFDLFTYAITHKYI